MGRRLTGDLGYASRGHGRLRDAEEHELIRLVHEEGDRDAREELIGRYLPLVRSLARRFASRGQSVEDLVQVGSIGLIKAIDRFDRERELSCPRMPLPPYWGRSSATF